MLAHARLSGTPLRPPSGGLVVVSARSWLLALIVEQHR